MRQNCSRMLLGGLLVLSAGLASGCAHWITMAMPSDTPLAGATVSSGARVPFLLETAHVTQNGSPIPPSAPLERQVLGAIEATRLFSHHYQSGYAPLAEDLAHVTGRLSIDTVAESHAGQAAWRGLAIGASLFALAPFLSLNYDYGTRMTIELERWDGHSKQYSATANGTAHYNLFGASPDVIERLKGQVTDACLASLLNQVVQDSALYLAGSPPPQAVANHTVSVGIRRALPRAVPVAQPDVHMPLP